jgi:hypothetical protein
MICLNGAISFYRERNVKKLGLIRLGMKLSAVTDEGNEEIQSKQG